MQPDTESAQTEPFEDPAQRAAGRSRAILIGAIIAGVLVVAAGALWFVFSGGGGSTTHAYVVPAGTFERTQRGEEVSIVPENLDVSVGDVLQIRNDDDQTHLVGPYVVGPHQTLQQRFKSPGELSGVCSLHPSGAVTITVHG